ncbi:MAG TPA: ABC transporter permease [Gemmatimonadaceae bacterium]|nr:ABC transporter permease [Gemmatimonadaceae bacterium]
MAFWRRRQRDFEDEIQSHLELETDQLIAQGMRPDDARLAARKRFGNVGAAQERYHDAGAFLSLEQLTADVRYALRMLRKTPLFTAVVTITLALGIGANTAVFSVVNGVLLAPLPYKAPDRLVELWETLPNADKIMISYPDFLDWKARNRVFEDIALYGPYGGKANTSGDVPRQLSVGTATANFFHLLGVTPIIGRAFRPEEDQPGGAPVALLGASYWRSEFAGDSAVLGRVISLDGEPYRIVGVLPALPSLEKLDAWLPMRADLDTLTFNRGNHPGLRGVGRLRPGVGIEQMRADLARISRQIVAEHPKEASGVGAGGDYMADLLVHNIKPALRVLSWAVLCVLLIACVNVANLILARATGRQREMSLRRALGAGQGRLVRLLLVENLLLALIGGALGVGLAYAAVRGIATARPVGVPRIDNIRVNIAVLLFATVASVVTGLLFGLLPARWAAAADPNEALKDSGRSSSASGAALRLRSALMTLEMAMTLVLLIGAGLLTRSFAKLVHVDPGVEAAGVTTGWLGLPTARYPGSEQQRLAMDDILHRVQGLPGVTSAALTSALPLSGNIQFRETFEGHPRPKGQEPLVQVQLITPDYFRTMGMRLLMGRAFAPSDGAGGQPVVWIDESIAKTYFPGENPVGKWIVHGGIDSKAPKQIIAGVVNAVHDQGLEERATGIVYMPFDQNPESGMALVVRSTLPLEQVTPSIRREIAAFDKQLPLSNEQTLSSVIDRSVGQERFTLLVLGNFAVMAVVLAGVGVYGVIAYFVAQRSQEIGIRVALGAQRGDVVRLVTRAVLVGAGTGIALGLVVAMSASHLMARLLYGVEPTDLPTYLGGAFALLVVAALAALVPTARATRVSPAIAMKSD